MLALTGSETRHDSLATYVLLRGLTLLVRTANKPQADPTLRWLLTPTRMKWVEGAVVRLHLFRSPLS